MWPREARVQDKDKNEEHDTINHEEYDMEHALGRDTCTGASADKQQKRSPAKGRRQAPRWVAGGEAGGP